MWSKLCAIIVGNIKKTYFRKWKFKKEHQQLNLKQLLNQKKV